MKAFIFDLDGVIVFTDKFHYQAWKKMADEMGIYFDETINNRLRGVSRSESLEIILERYEGPALSKEKKAELEKLTAEKEEEDQKRILAAVVESGKSADEVIALIKGITEENEVDVQ